MKARNAKTPAGTGAGDDLIHNDDEDTHECS